MWTWSIIHPLFLGISAVLPGAYGDSKFKVRARSGHFVYISVYMKDSPTKRGEMTITYQAVCYTPVPGGDVDLRTVLRYRRDIITSSSPGPLYRYNDLYNSYDFSDGGNPLENWKRDVKKTCDFELKETDMTYFQRNHRRDVYFTLISGKNAVLSRIS
ncbi:hypothetical protein FOZ61_006060 [Perkinsus olseni]|uniref:Uncharacterized protein n=1 Tax=Perkinsus olseni TaxID=32597 RepID=A0A7J6LFJ5_PEROL|nr:hypothetical protein FOZ61_006060 [Perkinsus olseni]KAF4658022.1 hypothetical protein FOL46_007141 [Perkinsus olseni]